MSKEDIFKEAKRNREEAQKIEKALNSKSNNTQPIALQKPNRDQPKLVGGIFFNPIPLEDANREHNKDGNTIVNNFFSLKKSNQDTPQKEWRSNLLLKWVSNLILIS